MRGLAHLLRLVPFATAAVAVAGVVHIGTIFAYPQRARDDAYARVAALGPVGTKVDLPAADAGILPARDPSMASAVCRYDLADGPFRVAVGALDDEFLSLGLHSRHGIPFYGLNLRAGESGPFDLVLMTAQQKADADSAEDGARRQLQIVAPEPQGFVTLDTPVDGPFGGQAALDRVACGKPGLPAPGTSG